MKDKSISELIDEALDKANYLQWGISNKAKDQLIIRLKEAKFWLNDGNSFYH